MEIPFADAMFGRLARRDPTDLAQHADEYVDVIDAVERQSTEPTLLLQRMENRLVRHDLAAPDVLSRDELRQLRYILNFARLSDFEPGAAGPGGRRGRGDVSVGAELAPWRDQVTHALREPLRVLRDPTKALTASRHVLAGLVDDQDKQRQLLLEHHRDDFSAAELDAEVGYKKLVAVMGGGGGSGFVYIGRTPPLL